MHELLTMLDSKGINAVSVVHKTMKTVKRNRTVRAWSHVTCYTATLSSVIDFSAVRDHVSLWLLLLSDPKPALAAPGPVSELR